jgi:predicted nuclease of restriction endonuclease-like (RecB) superfamily
MTPGRPGRLLGAKDYRDLLREVRARILSARTRAALSVNRELVLLYWQIGRLLLARESQLGWGAKVIPRIAADLRREFPDFRGLSARNLRYMRDLARAWPRREIVQRSVAKLPWRHNCRLLDRVSTPAARRWYLQAAIEHGWSGDVLAHQIETRLFERQGKALTNFARTLPPSKSELAEQLLKDPYCFDFLTLRPSARERELHRGLLRRLRDFLIELGVGFSFVASGKHIEIDGRDFYLDLLFYHLRLRSFVVVELKMGEFQAEHAGKMNLYLSAVDDRLRHPHDGPTVGIVLCRTRSRVIAEYALRDMRKPMGVATWSATQALPEAWRKNLPSIRTLEMAVSPGSKTAPDDGGRSAGAALDS